MARAWLTTCLSHGSVTELYLEFAQFQIVEIVRCKGINDLSCLSPSRNQYHRVPLEYAPLSCDLIFLPVTACSGCPASKQIRSSLGLVE